MAGGNSYSLTQKYVAFLEFGTLTCGDRGIGIGQNLLWPNLCGLRLYFTTKHTMWAFGWGQCEHSFKEKEGRCHLSP